MKASGHPDRQLHGRTDVFFKPPSKHEPDTRPLRERHLNKRAMDLKQTGGLVKIKGGQMQFGRHREGDTCPVKIAQDKGDLEWSDKVGQMLRQFTKIMYFKWFCPAFTHFCGAFPTALCTTLF